MKFKKTLISFISFLTIFALFMWQTALADTVDQSNHTGAISIGFGDTLNGRDYMCQGFKMATYNTITAIGFYVNSKDGDANVGYKVWIDNADANSNPLGVVGVGIGGATEITNASLTTSGLTKYTLTTNVPITIGNQYVICAAPWNTSTHVWASSYHDWVSSTANPYANGKRVHLDGSFANPTYPDSSNDDILFDVYGITSVATASSGSIMQLGMGF